MQISDKGLFKTQAYVDGQWIDADSGETLAVLNPANGETIAEIAKCGTAETRRAIEAAEKAQKLGKAARCRINAAFKIDRMVEEIEKVYDELVKANQLA